MDEKLKTKWVKALRSGKYKQAKQALRTDNGYCCLGVLCEVMPGVKWDERECRYIITNKKLQEEIIVEGVVGHLGIFSLPSGASAITGEQLPYALAKIFGMLKKAVYEGQKMDVHCKLTTLNDKSDIGFDGIADYIEKVL